MVLHREHPLKREGGAAACARRGGRAGEGSSSSDLFVLESADVCALGKDWERERERERGAFWTFSIVGST